MPPKVTVRVRVAAQRRRGWRNVHGSTWRQCHNSVPQRARARSRELTSAVTTRPHPRRRDPSHAPGSLAGPRCSLGPQKEAKTHTATLCPWPPSRAPAQPEASVRGGEAGAVSARPTAAPWWSDPQDGKKVLHLRLTMSRTDFFFFFSYFPTGKMKSRYRGSC